LKTLLVTPPFSQLNTPYPAISYLCAFLREKGHSVDQVDLGIIVINKILSKEGLERIFSVKSVGRVGALKESYIKTIDPVIDFLKGKNPTLENRIVNSDFLPQSTRFDNLESDIENNARYLATLYINDIGDYITQNIDKNFGFSRYSERLGLSPASFSIIQDELERPTTVITDIILEEWSKIITREKYDVIGITIPFPGNLISTLKISSYIKKIDPNIKIIIGGGWVNTELRSLTEKKFFDYVDYVVLDDGETPIELILRSLSDKNIKLNRTYTLKDGKVVYHKNSSMDPALESLPATDYKGLDLSLYISLLDTLNPMHSLWNNGRWNKLTLAHGCYWKRCAFCDTSLPYINSYHQSNATSIVDKIEKIIKDTGQTGFHFVDEAAPPALLKEVSLEIIRRGLAVTWWTNIRFETRFTRGLARLMAKSGCIGVSGGVEVASDRLLKLMDKGVTVNQVTKVTASLGQEGILVHAYLMYGFPSQTDRETVDALEIVRQLFQLGLIQSAYWHQFALTAHSRVGINPKEYGVSITGPKHEGFAKNDLEFSSSDKDPSRFSNGLKTSLYNFMRGNGLNLPLSRWFDFPIPKTKIKKSYLEDILATTSVELKDSTQIVWIGSNVEFKGNIIYLYDNTSQESITLDEDEVNFIKELLEVITYKKRAKITLKDVDSIASKYRIDPDLWLSQESTSILYDYGLVLI